MNEFDDILIGYYGDESWYRKALFSSSALVEYYNSTKYRYICTFDEFIELIVEEKKKNYRNKQIESVLNGSI